MKAAEEFVKGPLDHNACDYVNEGKLEIVPLLRGN